MIYILLVLFCFIANYLYYRKISKSLLHTFFLAASSLTIAAVFFTMSYDIQDIYSNLPILSVFNFLGYMALYWLYAIYIVSIFVLLKLEKEKNQRRKNELLNILGDRATNADILLRTPEELEKRIAEERLKKGREYLQEEQVKLIINKRIID